MRTKYQSPPGALYKKLLESYDRCIRNKRHVKKTKFHLFHEFHINKLALDIHNNTYFPGISNIFVILSPKPREVVAASLRDRIVHHYIYDYMESYWEKRFSPYSYACRPGKGPLNASKSLNRFLRAHHFHNRKTPLWYMKVDVSSFFPSIDKEILWKTIAKHMQNKKMLDLCEKVLFHNPVAPGQYRMSCPKTLWREVPKRKSLFYAPKNKGLPIGNLSSQFWANIYMNVLDQWIARKVKGKALFWQRYVDDILVIGEDQKFLKTFPLEINSFLEDKLSLSLNPKKTLLQPIAKGLDHLGYFHKPHSMRLRRKVFQRAVINLEHRLDGGSPKGELLSVMGSYLGNFSQCESFHKRKTLSNIVKKCMSDHFSFDSDYKKMCLQATEAEFDKENESQNIFLKNFIAAPWKDESVALDYLLTWLDMSDIFGSRDLALDFRAEG